jgi:SAM-dependent methyltransferase
MNYDARYYDAIYAWKDYQGEVAALVRLLASHGIANGRLLDVACGTGRHLEGLRETYEVEGVELLPDMIAVAQARVPDAPIHRGDMRTFRLDRTFDAVTCLFSAIGHMTEPKDLHAAIANMAAHLRPGGILAVEPWLFPQGFFEGHVGGDFHDEKELKIARVGKSFVEGPISVIEMHHLVGTPGNVEYFIETLRLGLYTDWEYRQAFESAGLAVDFDPEGLMGRGIYFGRKADEDSI